MQEVTKTVKIQKIPFKELSLDEQELLQKGSKQKDLWGINLFPAKFGANGFIMYESMINIKPHHNPSMSVKSKEVRNQIKAIIDEVVHE